MPNTESFSSAVRLVSHLQGLGVKVYLDDGQLRVKAPKGVMNAQLVDQLKEQKEAIISFLNSNKANEQEIEIHAVERSSNIPLSFSQQRLWVIDQLQPGTTAYNIASGVVLKGGLDVTLFEQAIQKIITRHEILRTRFVSRKGIPFQVIDDEMEQFWQVQDIASSPENQQKEILQQALAQEELWHFNLETGPLFRVKVFVIEPSLEHALIVNMHHIISDGWSTQVFLQELLQTYIQLQQGISLREIQLPEMSIQYADFSIWQREHATGKQFDKQLEYWVNQLADVPQIKLPNLNSAVENNVLGSFYSFSLPIDLKHQVDDFCKSVDVTPFVFWLANFNWILARFTEQFDFAVGTPIANRNRKELEPLIGYFVNTMAIRVPIEESQSFQNYLLQVKQAALDGFQYQDVPFERIVDELNLPRDLHSTPIFQVLLNYQVTHHEQLNNLGVEVEPLVAQHRASKFPMRLGLVESETELKAELEYQPELFPAEWIAGFSDLLVNQVYSVIQNANVTILEADLFYRGQQLSWIKEWGHLQETKAVLDDTVLDWFLGSCDRDPQKIAIETAENQISFGDLKHRVDKYAHRLMQEVEQSGQSDDPNPLVAILLDRSIDYVTWMLATWRAGYSFLPLDIHYPQGRIELLLEQALPQILIHCETTKVKDFPGIQIEVGEKGDVADLGHQREEGNFPTINCQDLAYVIYTSGSTGTPKGVEMTHSSLPHLLLALDNCVYKNNPCDRVLVNASFGFDASIKQWLQICKGRTLVLVDQDVRLDPRKMLEFIETKQVDCADFTPTHVKALVSEVEKNDQSLSPFLKVLLIGGEDIPQDLWLKLSSLHGEYPIAVFNLYGPTEACVDSTCVQIDADKKPRLGELLSHVKGCVVDRNNQLVPVGFPGELLLGGAGLARGYRHDAQLTDASFNHLLFTQLSDQGVKEVNRFYRTGDKVRWLTSGQLQYLGRMDEQIKWQGHRLEPAEIETVIESFPSVLRAGVKCFSESGNRPSALVAFIQFNQAVSRDNQNSVDKFHWQNTLRDHLLNRLPHYLMPTAFVRVDELPISAHGKLDRTKLEWNGDLDTTGETPFRTATTETELKLVRIWRGLLPLSSDMQIGIDQNFFQLGGHSLLATQLVAQIKSEFQLDFTLRNVFEASSLQTMADMIDARILQKGTSTEINPISERTDIPVTLQQRKLCILEELFDAGSTYLMPIVFKVEGDWQEGLFKQSLLQLQNEFELLRTRITKRNDEFFFEPVADPIEVDVYQEESDSAASLLRQRALKPFSIFDGLLWRVVIVKESGETGEVGESDAHCYHVAVVFHHLISDAWSNRILLKRWFEIYQSILQNRFEAFNKATDFKQKLDYLDYAHWQRSLVQTGRLESQIAFWRDRIKGVAPLELPVDFSRPALQSFEGNVIERSVSIESLQALLSHCSQQGYTVFDVMISGYALALSRYAQQKEFAIGIPLSGRHQAGLDEIVGLFVNTLPLIVQIEEQNTVDKQLAAIKESLLALYENQDCPLEMVLDSVSNEQQRDPSRPPLFQVMMNFVQEEEGNALLLTEQEDLKVELESAQTTTAKYELTLGVVHKSTELQLSLEYNSRLFTKETAERILDTFCVVLDQMDQGLLKADDELIATITGVDKQVLETYPELVAQNNERVGARVKSLQERLADRVNQTPDQVAVVSTDESLSFQQLDQRACQLACELEKRSVGKGDNVVLFMERTPDWIAAQVAVVKLGAVFIPLDPHSPFAKVKSILHEACPKQVISNQSNLVELLNNADWPESLIFNCVELPANTSDQSIESTALETIDESDPVYCIYTSGSTGKPKGVLVAQRGLLNLIDWHLDYHQLSCGDRLSHVAGQGFDASIWEVWPALVAGAALVLPPEGILLESESLIQWLNEREINQSFLPTAVVEQLFHYFQTQGDHVSLPQLKRILTGGDQLKSSKPEKFPVAVFNHYGPTEASVVTTVCEVSSETAYLPLIGNPIDNCHLNILDKDGRNVPPGAVGELHIGGKPVAVGYVGSLEDSGFYQLGAESFYASGDLVRIHGRGGLQFVNRKDQQIQLNGIRIELGEIEFHINALNWVQECAVSLQKEKLLVANLVLSEEGRKLGINHYDSSQLVSFLQESLTGILNFVAIPKLVMLMECLPLTESGKIDRNALPKVGDEQINELFRYVAPSSDLEERVQSIWQSVLKQPSISVEANFFSLGGHSLQATQIVNRITKEFQISLPMQSIFQNPTIVYMAAKVHELQAKPSAQQVASIGQSSRRKTSMVKESAAEDQQEKQRQLKEQLKGLSKEQLRALLAKKQNKKDYK